MNGKFSNMAPKRVSLSRAARVPTDGGINDDLDQEIALRQLIEILPGDQQVIFEGRVSGLTYPEIAQKLGCTPPTVGKNLKDGIHALSGRVRRELR